MCRATMMLTFHLSNQDLQMGVDEAVRPATMTYVSTLLKGLIRWLVHIHYNPKAITKTGYSTLMLNKRESVLRCMTANQRLKRIRKSPFGFDSIRQHSYSTRFDSTEVLKVASRFGSIRTIFNSIRFVLPSEIQIRIRFDSIRAIFDSIRLESIRTRDVHRA